MQHIDWGLIPYAEALKRQTQSVEDIAAGRASDTLVICSHPPVVTVGRGTRPDDVFAWHGETVEVSRGGRATYHGPSQIVVYPIIDLQKPRKNLPPKDLRTYTQVLQTAIVNTLKEFGIDAEAREVKPSADTPSLTGVWVGEKKLASIGFAVRKWMTYHGLALNVLNDPQAFRGINPCGFQSQIMGSMESVLNKSVPIDVVKSVLLRELELLLAV